MPKSFKDEFPTYALAGGLAVLIGLCLFLQYWWTQTSLDISVYWEAGTRMRQGGADLYAPSVDPANHVGYFIYPPFFAALFAPLTWLPRWAGYAAWTLGQLALMWAAFEAARRLAGLQTRRGLAIFLLAALWGALWMNLVEGQVNLLVAALVCWAWLSFEQGRPVRGGLLLAAAIHVKVIPVVLVAVLVVQGRFKAALATLAGCALLWLAPLVWTLPAEGAGGFARNLELTTQYADAVAAPRVKTQSTDSLGGIRAPNNGLPATWQRWFGKGGRVSYSLDTNSPLVVALPEAAARWGGLALAALMGLGALGAAWRSRANPQGRALAAGLALMAAMFGNLLFWPHHMCAAVILLAPLYARVAGTKLTWVVAVGLIVLAWLPINESLPPLAWLGAWGTPTLAFAALWGLGMWITLRPAPLQGDAGGLYSAAHETTTRNSAA